MDNRRLMTMQVFERIEQLISPAQNLVNGEGFAGLLYLFTQQFIQVFSGKQLHHQILRFTFCEMIRNVRQCPMAQPMQQPRLSSKSPAESLISEVSFLHRDPAAKPQILSQVDPPHPALIEQR